MGAARFETPVLPVTLGVAPCARSWTRSPATERAKLGQQVCFFRKLDEADAEGCPVAVRARRARPFALFQGQSSGRGGGQRRAA